MFPISATVGTLFLVLFILFTVGAIRALVTGQKKSIRAAILYLLATLVLVLSLVEFASIAIFVSDTNIPIYEIYGSGIRLTLSWVNLLVTTILWLLLGWRFLPNGKARPELVGKAKKKNPHNVTPS